MKIVIILIYVEIKMLHIFFRPRKITKLFTVMVRNGGLFAITILAGSYYNSHSLKSCKVLFKILALKDTILRELINSTRPPNLKVLYKCSWLK